MSSTIRVFFLYIMLYKVVLTFESVDEILKYDHFPVVLVAFKKSRKFFFAFNMSTIISCI